MVSEPWVGAGPGDKNERGKRKCGLVGPTMSWAGQAWSWPSRTRGPPVFAGPTPPCTTPRVPVIDSPTPPVNPTNVCGIIRFKIDRKIQKYFETIEGSHRLASPLSIAAVPPRRPRISTLRIFTSLRRTNPGSPIFRISWGSNSGRLRSGRSARCPPHRLFQPLHFIITFPRPSLRPFFLRCLDVLSS